MRLLFFLGWIGCAASLVAREGTVYTRSGEGFAGQIRLDTNAVVVINATEGRRVRVPLTNLVELRFDKPLQTFQPTTRTTPLDWESADIGQARVPGRARVIGGFYELTVATRNVPQSRHFYHRKVEGDAEIAARIISLPGQGTVAAGLMLSAGLEQDTPFVSVMLTSDRRTVVQRRPARENPIESRSERIPAPWLKLKRHGTNVAAYQSTDGRRWRLMHSTTLEIGEPVCIGLVAAAEYLHESAVQEVRCGFDQVRQAPYLMADWFVPRVELESGSVVVGRIRSADYGEVRFDSVFDPEPLSTRAVSRIMFDWLPPHARLPGGQSGVVLTSGEFVEGAFDTIHGNRLTIHSVLFGRRTFDIYGEVAAVILRPAQAQTPVWELTTTERSRWLGASMEITSDELGIWDASLGRRTFAAYDLELVRLLRPNTP